MKCSGIN